MKDKQKDLRVRHPFAWFYCAFWYLLICLPLSGCAAVDEADETQMTVALEEQETLNFYIWSDEESYVRQVTEAYNMLKGWEAVRLHVIPNDEHEEWLANYDPDCGADLVGLRGNANLVEMQSKGALLGLSQYLKNGELDVTTFGNMYNEIIYQGEYYAVPTRSTCWVLYYNKELFDEAGIPYPGEMTWEEYLALAEQMTWGEGEAQVWGGYFPPWIYHMSAIQSGYYLLDDDLEPVEESLELLNRLYESGTHVPYEQIKDRGDDCRYDFEKGNIAMMVNGEWLVNMLLEDEAAGHSVPDWDIAPLPVPEGVEVGTTVGMYQFAAITSTCSRPDEAFEFLTFLSGQQGAEIYARNAVIPAFSSDEIVEIYAEASGTKHSDIFFDAKKIQEQPMWYGYDRLLSMFKEYADKYLSGEDSLRHVMDDFEEERREVLRPSA